MQFRGVAHPRPGASDPDVANLTAAEIETSDESLRGKPICVEHNMDKVVGRCLAAWPGSKGELRVAGSIHDAATEAQLRNGSMLGLSLSTDGFSDNSGNTVFKNQRELSVCKTPWRPGCYIDTIDGKKIGNPFVTKASSGTAKGTLPTLFCIKCVLIIHKLVLIVSECITTLFHHD